MQLAQRFALHGMQWCTVLGSFMQNIDQRFASQVGLNFLFKVMHHQANAESRVVESCRILPPTFEFDCSNSHRVNTLSNMYRVRICKVDDACKTTNFTQEMN